MPDYHHSMHRVLPRLRARFGRSNATTDAPTQADACAWDAMRATYEEQAARGVPEAVRGLELIREDRWPTSGRHRDGVVDG